VNLGTSATLLHRFNSATHITPQAELLQVIRIISDYGDSKAECKSIVKQQNISHSALKHARLVMKAPNHTIALPADIKQHSSDPDAAPCVTMVARNALSIFAATSASRAIDSHLYEILRVPRHTPKPIIIALFGKPAVGKNVLARRFARQMYDHLKLHNDQHLPVDFNAFYHEHDCAQLKLKESVSAFVGTPVGVQGKQGKLANQLRENARVIVLDEADKAHDDVLSVLTKLFDEGKLNHLSDEKSQSYVECVPKTVFFVLANVDGKTPEEKQRMALFDKILSHDDFKACSNQSDMNSIHIKNQLTELRKLYFSGNTALQSRTPDLYLAYRPDPKDDPCFDPTVVCSILQSKLCILLKGYYETLRWGWTSRVVDVCVRTVRCHANPDFRSCGNDIHRQLNKAWLADIDETGKEHLLSAGTHALIVDTMIIDDDDECAAKAFGVMPDLSFVMHVVVMSEDMKLHCDIIDAMVKGSQSSDTSIEAADHKYNVPNAIHEHVGGGDNGGDGNGGGSGVAVAMTVESHDIVDLGGVSNSKAPAAVTPPPGPGPGSPGPPGPVDDDAASDGKRDDGKVVDGDKVDPAKPQQSIANPDSYSADQSMIHVLVIIAVLILAVLY
jgi:AAA domain (Cdc48 subfamily)